MRFAEYVLELWFARFDKNTNYLILQFIIEQRYIQQIEWHQNVSEMNVCQLLIIHVFEKQQRVQEKKYAYSKYSSQDIYWTKKR